jgi:transcriptional regulator with XRE-family HTH domain
MTMKDTISQEEIGKRIAQLRKLKGLSQEDVAKRIELPRSSLAQIERGNRKVDSLVLNGLALAIGFSIDYLMSKDFNATTSAREDEPVHPEKTEERISVPKLQVEKFKNVLLYILERCAGKPNVGETVLYKLLYFSDFNYYELYEEQMTGANYRKLSYGPVPRRMDAILNQMIEEGQLQRIKTEYHGYPQTRYIPLTKSDLTQLKASEVEVIDNVLYQMSDWSAAMISEYSHGDKPWKATGMNEDLDYELAFYRRPPYSVRVYKEEEDDI